MVARQYAFPLSIASQRAWDWGRNSSPSCCGEEAGFLPGQLQLEEGHRLTEVKQNLPLYCSQRFKVKLLEPFRLERTCHTGDENSLSKLRVENIFNKSIDLFRTEILHSAPWIILTLHASYILPCSIYSLRHHYIFLPQRLTKTATRWHFSSVNDASLLRLSTVPPSQVLFSLSGPRSCLLV